jgi:hypothetical protein
MSLRIASRVAIIAIVACCRLLPVQADEPVLLKYKVAQGETLHYKNLQSVKQAQSLTVNGMTIKQDNSLKQEAILTRVADEVGSDGKTTYRVKAERRKMTAEFGALGKFEFDSKSTERDTGSAIGAALIPLLERLTGSEYQVIVNPQGTVGEVKGYAELIADILNDNPLGGQFGGGDNAAAVISEQDAFVVLSDKPVNVGDKWEVPVEKELAKLGKMKARTTYTYEGPDTVGDKKTVRIAIAGEMTMELNLDQGGMKVSGTLTSSSLTGTVQFDPAAGRVMSIKRSVTLGGMLTVEAGGMIIPVDNQQEQTTAFELLEKLPE